MEPIVSDPKEEKKVHHDTVGEQLAWQHAIHEEQVLNERAGLFLVAQAMMLGFYASLPSSVGARSLVVLAMVGLAMCALWAILNRRQVDDLAQATETLEELSPFYCEYLRRRPAKGPFRKWDRPILAWGLPLLVAIVWTTLLLNGTGILGL